MKNLLLISLVLIFFSCKKESLYKDKGILPVVTQDTTKQVTLNGTTWVLTNFKKGLSSATPNDTIRFEQFNYYVNGKTYSTYEYILSQTMDLGNPFDLRLYGFSPFGDNGIWQTTIVNTFISEGVINLAEFTNPSSQSSVIIRANFKRIK
jgi:hypothetical protein